MPTTSRPSTPPRATLCLSMLAIWAVLALLIPLGACVHVPFLHRGEAELRSMTEPVLLSPSLPVRAYVALDKREADVYLTDLSDDQLTRFFDDDASWATFEGQIVHVRMFIQPRAGRTPIEPTAISATVRYAIMSNGSIGVYAGAGFCLPRSDPGGNSFAASLTGADVRLARATPDFVDLLGPARLSVDFNAPNNPELAATLRERLDALARYADPVDARVSAPVED
ncbi:MAG: hypothetical protein AAF356_13010 [Planctomycetota bacterium]